MVDAVETRPGTDPDRASFTTAMEAARDQLTAARGICPDGPVDLPGAIGRAVLATCCPPAAPGTAPARSNAPLSRYPAEGPNITRRSYKATLSISILATPDP